VKLTGFEVPEIDVILEDADSAKAEGIGPEDRAPDPLPESITRPGDLWLLGKHRLFCGNALAGTAGICRLFRKSPRQRDCVVGLGGLEPGAKHAVVSNESRIKRGLRGSRTG
jgi:hypothetical protein